MLENYAAVALLAASPSFKPALISQLEHGKEPCFIELQGQSWKADLAGELSKGCPCQRCLFLCFYFINMGDTCSL
ncbi:hypothetical protein MDA_GLEAN10023272 [Myotis davidii]|uniref:KRAB domain-containing protein n=1 Tax=Myotis davidii TaxID=225400 RepID=L5LHJ0_MYODS|nr:hypothetical protein MDA_GLEAN10023272 [Myotis davidii]